MAITIKNACISLAIWAYSFAVLAVGLQTPGQSAAHISARWQYDGLPCLLYYIVVPLNWHVLVFLRRPDAKERPFLACLENYILIAAAFDSSVFFISSFTVAGEPVFPISDLVYFFAKVFIILSSVFAYVLLTCSLLVTFARRLDVKRIRVANVVRFAVISFIVYRICLVIYVYVNYPAIYVSL